MANHNLFTQYPDFDHDSTAALLSEFERLSLHQGWDANGSTYRQARRELIPQELEHHYGHSSDRLAGWQMLCVDCGISPAPTSITQWKKVCRSAAEIYLVATNRFTQALSRVNVCINDLLDSCRAGKPVKLFSSKKALRDHLKKQRKHKLPIDIVKASRFLRALLIDVYGKI